MRGSIIINLRISLRYTQGGKGRKGGKGKGLDDKL